MNYREISPDDGLKPYIKCFYVFQSDSDQEFEDVVFPSGFTEIKNKLASIPGVFIVAFCESQQLVMMRLDKKKLADNKPVFDAFSELGFKFNVKEGATISKAKRECKDKNLKTYSHPELPSE